MSGQIPGMLYPTQQGMSAGNQRDSAIANQNGAATKLANLNNAVGGKKNKKNKRGGTGIVVPQFQMQYTPTGGQGQDPNSIITQNAGVSTQGYENQKYDSYARLGGKRRNLKGGNSKWNWGCSSGGRRTKRTSSKRRSSKITKSRRNKSRTTRVHKK